MPGRSPSPYSRRRPSPPRRRRSRDRSESSSPKRRRRDRTRSPPRRRRSSSPPPRKGRHYENSRSSHSQTELDNIPILPQESFSEYRTRVRSLSKKTIWSASPERPTRSPSPEKTHKSKKKSSSKRHDSDSESDSDEDRHRRHRRHKKKSQKSSSHRSSRRSRSSSKKRKRYSSDESSDSEKEVQVHTEDKPVLEVDSSQLDAVQDLWVEKQVDLLDDLAPVGPAPLVENDDHNVRAYGGALLPGEGSAMAAYVQQGKRIPRRGEIGLSGDQILDFEKAGYVMSGNRHQRMNAVRLRKENQVISAEEKRLVLQHAQEQKMKRENEIISGFREILSDKFKKEE
ncbi:ras-induced vulval development antagonist-domain-containing protein [Thamnidium elegans]|nr:ras-induced vulval development antagonist-domain-containing protein [Thamnidium elegans]